MVEQPRLMLKDDDGSDIHTVSDSSRELQIRDSRGRVLTAG